MNLILLVLAGIFVNNYVMSQQQQHGWYTT